MAILPLPQISAMNDAKGQSTTHNHKFLQSIETAARDAETAIATINAQKHDDTLTISFPVNQDYPFVQNSSFGYTISSVTTKCSSGSCTLAFKINGVALGGGSNSVSTTEQIKTHTSANVVAVGDDLVATVTSNSSCQYLIATVTYTRA